MLTTLCRTTENQTISFELPVTRATHQLWLLQKPSLGYFSFSLADTAYARKAGCATQASREAAHASHNDQPMSSCCATRNFLAVCRSSFTPPRILIVQRGKSASQLPPEANQNLGGMQSAQAGGGSRERERERLIGSTAKALSRFAVLGSWQRWGLGPGGAGAYVTRAEATAST